MAGEIFLLHAVKNKGGVHKGTDLCFGVLFAAVIWSEVIATVLVRKK